MKELKLSCHHHSLLSYVDSLLQHQISLTEGLHCKAEHGNEVVANQNIWNVCTLAAIPYLGGGALGGQFEQDSITHVGVHEQSVGPFSPALPWSPILILL